MDWPGWNPRVESCSGVSKTWAGPSRVGWAFTMLMIRSTFPSTACQRSPPTTRPSRSRRLDITPSPSWRGRRTESFPLCTIPRRCLASRPRSRNPTVSLPAPLRTLSTCLSTAMLRPPRPSPPCVRSSWRLASPSPSRPSTERRTPWRSFPESPRRSQALVTLRRSLSALVSSCWSSRRRWRLTRPTSSSMGPLSRTIWTTVSAEVCP
mmetsp:Transcript_33287/g.61316  ORF Transcript_33287/g.61316 Transcript_33287/m.61316 type:complete len:208 (+) Transcript_33287:956-1579(+)